MKAFHAFHYGLISRAQRDNIWIPEDTLSVRCMAWHSPIKRSCHPAGYFIRHGEGQGGCQRFGKPDPDVMSGKKRSVFSPP